MNRHRGELIPPCHVPREATRPAAEIRVSNLGFRVRSFSAFRSSRTLDSGSPVSGFRSLRSSVSGSRSPASAFRFPLRQQQNLAGRRPTFERTMRVRGRGQRERRSDSHAQIAVCNPPEQITGARAQFIGCLRVVGERRPGKKQRPFWDKTAA